MCVLLFLFFLFFISFVPFRWNLFLFGSYVTSIAGFEACLCSSRHLFNASVRNYVTGTPLNRFLSAIGDVVVVIPNYRLGALGFLYDGTDEAPGNVGLHDQLVAIHWTRQHIEHFGGNSSDIVLMGHGSGATSIGHHLLSVDSSSPGNFTFKKVILMSETPFTRYASNEIWQTIFCM